MFNELQEHVNTDSLQSAVYNMITFETVDLFFHSFPFVPLQRRGCLVAPLFL
jgi:hypothetical protein